METKVMRRFFGLADFIEEQDFLQEQHRGGWKFKRLEGLSKYTFEKCEPAEYVYQLDYKEDATDEDSYIRMFEDFSWEYVMKYGTWYYFRKEKSDSETDNCIFSDAESKIDLCRKVYLRQSIMTFLPTIVIILAWSYFNREGTENPVLRILNFFPLLFAIGIIGLATKNVMKLRKMMSRLKNPLDKKE